MKVKIHGIYKHFKGNYYIVEDIAIDSESGEKMVISRGLYDNNELFARPIDSFSSLVDKNKYPECNQKYRFELQDIFSKNNIK